MNQTLTILLFIRINVIFSGKRVHSQLIQVCMTIKKPQRQVIHLVVIQVPMDKLSQSNGNFSVYIYFHNLLMATYKNTIKDKRKCHKDSPKRVKDPILRQTI